MSESVTFSKVIRLYTLSWLWFEAAWRTFHSDDTVALEAADWLIDIVWVVYGWNINETVVRLLCQIQTKDGILALMKVAKKQNNYHSFDILQFRQILIYLMTDNWKHLLNIVYRVCAATYAWMCQKAECWWTLISSTNKNSTLRNVWMRHSVTTQTHKSTESL